jgi:mitogen-activated protein kinase kinase kinase 9
MQTAEDFQNQKWRDETTGRINCINFEYWIKEGNLLQDTDSESEEEEEQERVEDYYSSLGVHPLDRSAQFWSASTCASNAELEVVPKYSDLKLYSNEKFLKSNDLQAGHCIGQGRTAVVWKGHIKDRGNNDAAIRKLSSLCDGKKVLQFLGDINALSYAPHPNVAQLLGVTFGEQPVQIVTEYCAGGSCYDLVYGSTPLTNMQAGKICVDVVNAMSHLHGLTPKVLHCNLTSRNVLLAAALTCGTSIPHAKVCDYSLKSLSLERDEQGSGYDSIWVAPEAQLGLYTEKADVFSFGIFMYELAYGTAPVQDVHATDLSSRIPTRISPQMHNGNTDALWTQVICSAWAVDAPSRPSFDVIKDTFRREPEFGRIVSL